MGTIYRSQRIGAAAVFALQNGTLAAPDTTAPAWPAGAEIAVTLLTSSSYTATAPAATDAAGVTAFRWRVNGGAWTAGQVAQLSGRTPASTDTVEFQAGDAAGNWSVSLARSITLQAAPDTTAPAWPAGAEIAVTLLTSSSYTATAPAATDAAGVTAFRWRVNGGAWTAGQVAQLSGRTPASTDTVEFQAGDAAGNWSVSLARSITLQAAPDTTAPAWPAGAQVAVTLLTSSSYTATAPAATDAAGVTAFRWRVNGGAWTAGQVAQLSGRTPASTDTVEFQAGDAAGNWSVSLARSITLQAAPPPMPTVLSVELVKAWARIDDEFDALLPMLIETGVTLASHITGRDYTSETMPAPVQQFVCAHVAFWLKNPDAQGAAAPHLDRLLDPYRQWGA